MSRFFLSFGVVLLTMLALEVVWFSVVVEKLYRPELGALLRAEIRVLPAVAFYLLYPACVVVLAVRPLDTPIDALHSFGRGAMLGLAAYGAYELTNLATLVGWSGLVATVDMAWGAILTSVAATTATIVTQRFFANSRT